MEHTLKAHRNKINTNIAFHRPRPLVCAVIFLRILSTSVETTALETVIMSLLLSENGREVSN